MKRRAVITGLGPITCIGKGKDAFWNGILAEQSGINRISTFDTTGFYAQCGGEIRDYNALTDRLLPALCGAGVSQKEICTLTEENPARAFALD